MKEIWNKASFIRAPRETKGAATVFYRAFSFCKNVKSAKLHIPAIGVYEVYINGERVDNTFMKPDYTSYKHRLQYQTISVGDKLTS